MKVCVVGEFDVTAYGQTHVVRLQSNNEIKLIKVIKFPGCVN
jgi:Ser-tRNA(Ala) deacylase AlaX